ncbi:MAG: hypothetical protein ACWGPN_08365, partial [Gammaproteobacteria bacterium]
VASEPVGAAAWYPVNDHPRDKATYRFEITVPQPYVVAANGLLALFGDKRVDDATALFEEAAECLPVDAMECLDIEQAKAELE